MEVEDIRQTPLYREFQAEREEILKHKWLESEKAGYDIGFERALTDWIIKHRAAWRRARKKEDFLSQIQERGIKISVFSDARSLQSQKELPSSEYSSRQGLAEIVGTYLLTPPNTLKKTSEQLVSPMVAGVFIDEYREGDKNYHLHFDYFRNLYERPELMLRRIKGDCSELGIERIVFIA